MSDRPSSPLRFLLDLRAERCLPPFEDDFEDCFFWDAFEEAILSVFFKTERMLTVMKMVSGECKERVEIDTKEVSV
jgi:hypothetical protein